MASRGTSNSRASFSMRSRYVLCCRKGCSTMIATLLISNISVIPRSVSGAGSSTVDLDATSAKLVCDSDDKPLNVVARYRDWQSFIVQLHKWNSNGPCPVNISFPDFSAASRIPLQTLLLFVFIKPMELRSGDDTMYFTMPSFKSRPFCIAQGCPQVYLWARRPVQLEMHLKANQNSWDAYKAKFVVTEATNVCDISNRNRELLIESGDIVYASSPDDMNQNVPHNDVICKPGYNYSLTMRLSSSSTLLNVIAVACPVNTRCATLLLNEENCTNDMTVTVPQHGLTLRYVRQKYNDTSTYNGFVVSVEKPSTSTSRYFVTPSRVATSTLTECRASQGALNAFTMSTKHGNNHTTKARIAAGAISTTVANAAEASRTPQLLSSASSKAFDVVTSSSARNATEGGSRSRYVTDATITKSTASDVSVNNEHNEPDAADPLSFTVCVATFATQAVAALAIGITIAFLCRRRKLLTQQPRLNEIIEAHSSERACNGEIAMV